MTDLADDIEPAARAAADRVTFQLTYDRATTPRRIQPGVIDGPWIPCAYGGDTSQPGGWYDPRDDPPSSDRTEQQWIDRYTAYAVAESVHEALEWFKLDGRPWLDPHGPAEQEIHQAVDELCACLAEIRARHQKGADRG